MVQYMFIIRNCRIWFRCVHIYSWEKYEPNYNFVTFSTQAPTRLIQQNGYILLILLESTVNILVHMWFENNSLVS